jgi:hypothetical protein
MSLKKLNLTRTESALAWPDSQSTTDVWFKESYICLGEEKEVFVEMSCFVKGHWRCAILPEQNQLLFGQIRKLRPSSGLKSLTLNWRSVLSFLCKREKYFYAVHVAYRSCNERTGFLDQPQGLLISLQKCKLGWAANGHRSFSVRRVAGQDVWLKEAGLGLVFCLKI